MIQEIAPHQFHNQFENHVPAAEDYLFVGRGDALLLRVTDGQIILPTVRELGVDPARCRTLFRQDDRFYVLLQDDSLEPPEGYAYYTKHQYREFGPMEVLFPVAAAGSLNRWYRDNRFCGRCGHEMADGDHSRARTCPCCGFSVHPKITPAVIAGIRSGDKLLVTRYNGQAGQRPSLVAGYNEIGESIEDTLRREVMEEVGLKVKNLRYYKSQPWVITDSLMIGIYCDLDGDPDITLQRSELRAGAWIDRKDLPPDTTHLSLTAEMIEQFRLGNY